MRDKELCRKILGIEEPWTVKDVELDRAKGATPDVVIERGPFAEAIRNMFTTAAGRVSLPRMIHHAAPAVVPREEPASHPPVLVLNGEFDAPPPPFAGMRD